jgi:hypothetical protein
VKNQRATVVDAKTESGCYVGGIMIIFFMIVIFSLTRPDPADGVRIAVVGLMFIEVLRLIAAIM